MMYTERLAILIIVVILVLVTGVVVLKAPMINVEIFSTGDPPENIYCATGSLAPPAVHMGSGSVRKGQESYC